jgi:uroporphyrinogen decarboxylase
LSEEEADLSQKQEHETTQTDALYNSPFMRACRREPVPYTPVWLMRQAGRYMREYREVRARHSFLEMCKKPEVASEVTVYAQERLKVDAAIIFADILLILEPMGIDLEFAKGEGPVIHNPVRGGREVERLSEVESVEALSYVFEAIRLTRRALPGDIPLIGFAGAPFTLASYMTEGGGSKNYIHTKRLMYTDAGAWHEMMSRISRALSKYLNAQIEAGAQAVQLFDSWVGCLSPDDYREFVLPHTREVIRNVRPGTPVIHFGTGTATLLELMREAGGDCIGLDWRVRLNEGWDRLGDVAVMGNLDPVALFADEAHVRAQAKKILDEAGQRDGHIFNLGHGILPETPVENVLALVEAVHELSRRH